MSELFVSVGSILQIVLINVVLSGDNAVVIALAAHHLPETQHRKAMLWGCLFAIALRLVLTLVVAYVLLIPGVRLPRADARLDCLQTRTGRDGPRTTTLRKVPEHCERRSAESPSPIW